MIVAQLVHFQIPADRQSEYEFPDSVQSLLREGGGPVCFFFQEIHGRRNKFSDPLIDLAENGLVQIQNVHAALPYGVFLAANKNLVAVKEHDELIICVGELSFNALHFLCYAAAPCTR